MEANLPIQAVILSEQREQARQHLLALLHNFSTTASQAIKAMDDYSSLSKQARDAAELVKEN